MNLLEILRSEKATNRKGGIYHQTQVQLSYNTNRIEGSKLSEEQTRYIYETNTLLVESDQEATNIDDILETVNHFACFNYMLDIADEALNEKHIKDFHKKLKENTSDARKDWFQLGSYKSLPNMVGGIETTLPEQVEGEMSNLIEEYATKEDVTVEDIIDFHFRFERIHPFQDGNGRVGRLIMFKECLRHNIVPFIIEDDHKMFYYRGLAEYDKVKEHLIDTCLSAQDTYKRMLDYYQISY